MARFFGRFGNRRRHVVATVLVAADGNAVAPLQKRVLAATQRIAKEGEDFAVASHEVAAVARALLDHESDWTHAALQGDVYDDEEGAGAAVSSSYADLARRYLSADDGDAPRNQGERRVVVMLTVAYAGEEGAIERDLLDRSDLVEVLQGIAALHERDALLAAQVHVAPAHPEDTLNDEQLLTSFPELLSI